jgi:hypothetical protein
MINYSQEISNPLGGLKQLCLTNRNYACSNWTLYLIENLANSLKKTVDKPEPIASILLLQLAAAKIDFS